MILKAAPKYPILGKCCTTKLNTDDSRHDEMLELSRRESLDSGEIRRRIDYAVEMGGIDYTFAMIDRLAEQACELLDRIPQCEATDALRALVRSLKN